MATLRGIITYFGFKADGNQLAAVNAQVAATKANLETAAKAAEGFREKLGASFGGLKSMIMGLAAGAGLKAFTLDFARDAEAIRKGSEALGMSAESYQVWGAAAKSAGVEQDQFNAILGKLSKNAYEASRGQGELVQVFSRAGIAVRDASGKVLPLEKLLGNVSDVFAKMPAGPARTALALKLFEEQGTKLLPFLSKGSKGVEELRQRMLKAGIIIGDKSLADAKKFTEAQKQMQAGLLGVRNTIGAAVLPYLTKGILALQKWITQTVGLKRIMAGLEAAAKIAAIAIGGILLGKLLAAVVAFKALGAAAMWANLKILLVPLALLAIALAIEDLYTFFRGGDSLIGRMLGPDASAKLMEFLNGVDVMVSWLSTVALEKVKAFGRGASKAFGSVYDEASNLVTKLAEFWEWVNKDPGEEEGWLGFVHGMLNGIIKAFRKAFELGQQLAELMGIATPETAVGLTTGADTSIDDAAATGMYVANENQRVLRDLGLPDDAASASGGSLNGLIGRGLNNRLNASPFDFGAISQLYDLQRATGGGGVEDMLRVNPLNLPGAPGATYAPVINVNVPVKTDADANEIARVAGQEIDRRVRTAYDDYLEASGVPAT